MSLPTVRAKFQCQTSKAFAHSDMKEVTFAAVCADDIPENQRFHKYTPQGDLKITIDNPAITFVPGQTYYLDFTPVPAKPEADKAIAEAANKITPAHAPTPVPGQ